MVKARSCRPFGVPARLLSKADLQLAPGNSSLSACLPYVCVRSPPVFNTYVLSLISPGVGSQSGQLTRLSTNYTGCLTISRWSITYSVYVSL